MRNYFHLADTSNDKNINKNEVTAFLDSINIKLKKDQLKKLIKVILINQYKRMITYIFLTDLKK